jgi:hypothetical protein
MWIHPGPGAHLNRRSNATIAEEIFLMGSSGLLAHLYITSPALAVEMVFIPILQSPLEGIDGVKTLVISRPFSQLLQGLSSGSLRSDNAHDQLLQNPNAFQPQGGDESTTATEGLIKRALSDLFTPLLISRACLVRSPSASTSASTSDAALLRNALYYTNDLIEYPRSLLDVDSHMTLYHILISEHVQRYAKRYDILLYV